MHKKIILSIALILVLFGAVACASSSGRSSRAGGTQAEFSASGFTDSSGNLLLPVKLAAGTLKLEGTPQAITAQQAKELLPLWKAVKKLVTSDTISQTEMKALYAQIQETMTAEQNKAIDEMGLDTEKIRTLMQERGIQFRSGGTNGNNTTQAGSSTTTRGGFDGGPGMGGMGGPPDMGGGGMPMPGGGSSTTTQSGASGYSPVNFLTSPLIKLLEGKIVQ